MKFFFMVLCFSLSVWAQSGLQKQNGAQVQIVYKAHELALNLTKKLKVPPPQMAFILGIANHAAFVSAQKSPQAALSYFVAFTEIYSLVYPQERAALQAGLTQQGTVESKIISEARQRALKIWQSVELVYREAAQPMPTPWPGNGYKVGGWKPTAPQYAQPLYPNWYKLPLYSGSQTFSALQSLEPIIYNSQAYHAELQEVRNLGGKTSQVRTPEQTQIAVFWAAGAGTVTPPGMWVEIAIKSLQAKNAEFSNVISTLRILSQALSDAGVVAWTSKFQHATCRPVTAVEEILGDKSWQPLLATPPFPSWVSGHSTFSSAAAVIVDALILQGQGRLDVQSEALPGQHRQFNTAWDAALEAGQSRIYGGIHFQDDNRDGLQLGHLIGCTLLARTGKAGRSCQ